MLGGGGEQPTVVGEQLVGLDPQRAGEVDGIERLHNGAGEFSRRAQQLGAERHQQAGGKEPVDLLNHRGAGVRQGARAGW